MQKKGTACRIPPTPKSVIAKREAAQKQAARTAAKSGSLPEAGQPADFYSKVLKLVQTIVSAVLCCAGSKACNAGNFHGMHRGVLQFRVTAYKGYAGR